MPYLALMGEIFSAFQDDFVKITPRYTGVAPYKHYMVEFVVTNNFNNMLFYLSIGWVWFNENEYLVR